MKVNHLEVVRRLLEKLEKYEEENPDGEFLMPEFAQWLYQSTLPIDRSASVIPEDKDKALKEHQMISLGALLVFMNRYAKFYFKKALEGSILSTKDEFAFLATLLERDMRKSELINHHLLEITSGTDILKRLEKNKLISYSPDPEDKRARRVHITQKGMNTFMELQGSMLNVVELISGDLSLEERLQLLSLLSKLERFHQTVYKDSRKSSLDEIKYRHLSEEKAP